MRSNKVAYMITKAFRDFKFNPLRMLEIKCLHLKSNLLTYTRQLPYFLSTLVVKSRSRTHRSTKLLNALKRNFKASLFDIDYSEREHSA